MGPLPRNRGSVFGCGDTIMQAALCAFVPIMPSANTGFAISTLIVDDEELARRLIGSLVQADEDLVLVGECGDGATALDLIAEKQPDLVFLDVQMPPPDGLGVASALARVEHPPYVIFVTAYEQFAVKAFELNALDYLMKPIEKARFHASVARAKTAIRNGEVLALTRRLLALGESSRHRVPSDAGDAHELTVKHGESIVQLTTSDVLWVEAASQYVYIHTASGTYTASESLSQYAKRIRDPRFFRIHRSALVNAAIIDDVARKPNGTHTLRLSSGQTLVVARSRAAIIPAILRAARMAKHHV